MRIVLMAVVGLGLAACSRRAEILENEYRQAPTAQQKCEVAGKVADAWLERSDAAMYEQWSLTRDIDCLYAETLRQAGLR